MDELLNKILEIDKIAQEKIKTAEEENDKFLKQVNDHKQEIINNMQKKADKRLCDLEENEIKNSEEEILKLEKQQKEYIKKLQNIYDEHCEKRVNDIVNRILS